MSGRRGGASVALLLAALAAADPPDLHADAYQERRIKTGLRLFRALLAADSDLERKTVEDGRLLILFLYTDDRVRAEELAAAFAKGEAPGSGGPVRGLPVVTETTADATFTPYAGRRPAAIFLTQAPDGTGLRTVIQFGIAQRIIVYSPFEGHVESGVLGGLAVEAQVRPYVNEKTLAASHISLKDFFLKVTKVYR